MDNTTTLGAYLQTYYDKRLLRRAKQAQVFYEAGKKRMLPKSSGKIASWRRFNTLTVNTTALTEGVTPTSTSLSMTEVTATPLQYGAYGEFSDLLDLLHVDPVITEGTDIFGQHAGESVETIIADVLKAGTSVFYGGGQTARANLTASHVATVDLIRKMVTSLDVNNAKRFNGPEENKKPGQGEYLLFMHPYVIADLKRDTEFKTMIQNTPGYEKLFSGEIAMIEGARIIQSTLTPVFSAAGSGGANVYASLLIGEEAFAILDTANLGKFETITQQLGSGGTSDPLKQRSTVGWKALQVAKILNNNFMTRLETGATGG